VEGVSVVIPAWNEASRLGPTLDRYLPVLQERGEPYEIIVVTDGSTDSTGQLARSYARAGVRVLEFPQKLGKGGAVMQGLQAAAYSTVGFLDADGPILPADVHRLIDTLREADCAVASRWLPESVIVRPQPAVRVLLGRAWNMLVRVMLRLPLKDTQCGAKFLRSATLGIVLAEMSVANWAFDVDLLYHMRKSGYSIREVPVTWQHDDASKLAVARIIPVMFLSVLGIRLMNLPFTRRLSARWTQWLFQRYGTA
jgi:glycosyltransferase involved in cell wall biosynthesis